MNLTDDECAVKIAVRERPLREIFTKNDKSVISYHTTSSNILIVDERPFVFDHVLPPNVSQEELFDFLVMPLVGKVLSGFHCTALAYGQTGTGKSFTMGLNPESFEGVNVGMIPRCIQAVLAKKDLKDEDENVKHEIYASFIEIYNEKVYDLLSENATEPIVARGYKFTGGTKKKIEHIQDGYTLLNQGTKNRHVRPTKMNAQSSRSHAIFTINVRSDFGNKITQSCLNLVDLAGSEGVRRTGHQGVALSEGVHINQGLLSIGKVLQAITHGYKVIPYRDSVLSSVLQDSLSTNSYFTLLACVSPYREDLSETLSTLRFAQNAKNLKHNPQINSKLMELKKKTPYKTNLYRPKQSMATPYKRPFSLVNSKANSGSKNPSCHGNTFCTPSKKRKTENPIFNRTDVGLTPKEKQKFGSVQSKVSKVLPFSFQPLVPESFHDQLNDESLESRGSLLSLNISTSTVLDAPPSKHTNTFSPMFRKYMAEMENTVKSSMSQLLTSFKDGHQTPNLNEQYIRNIFRQELQMFTTEKKIRDPKTVEGSLKCELFRASSPIFKVPDVPDVQPGFYSNKTSNLSHDGENFLSINETVRAAKPLRRSRRLLSVQNQTITTDESVFLPMRRSARLSSIKTLNDERRRSIRLASHKELKEEIEIKEPVSHNTRTVKNCPERKKTTKALINNPTIAGYFDKTDGKAPKKTSLVKHRKAILEMLNTASMKELQFLPQVGLKTAFQIVTQRTLHGKFKNFTQVGKLPIWRGKAWERFQEANSLS